MQLDFWHSRWQQGQTGFHQSTVNPYLTYYYGEKGPGVEQRQALKVFIPLCGKTKDMHWLASNGYTVIGNECSEIAVKDFFSDIALAYNPTQSGKHVKYVPDQQHLEQLNIEILQGDFFDLRADDLDDVTDIFDRAALIALPEELRAQYVKKMVEIQKSGTRTLLVSMDYPQDQMNGPPFSVNEEEVHRLYGENFSIEKLAEKNILADETKFQERGLTRLYEVVYKLTRK